MGQIIYLAPKDDKTIKKNSSELHGHGPTYEETQLVLFFVCKQCIYLYCYCIVTWKFSVNDFFSAEK